jgi:EF hand domain-containing protein
LADLEFNSQAAKGSAARDIDPHRVSLACVLQLSARFRRFARWGLLINMEGDAVMIRKTLAFATVVAMGMTAAAIAQQQPSQQPSPSQRSTQPTQPSTQPRTTQPTQPSQTTPRGGDRTEQVSFDRADKDADGRVNREEGNDIDGFDFSRADTNNDGSLSRQEYQAAMATSSPREGPAARSEPGAASRSGEAPAPRSGEQRTAQVTFDTADKDKDGKITRTEAADVPGLNFSSADVNADAALSRQEFQTAMAGAQPRG